MTVTFGYCVEAPIEWRELLRLAADLDRSSRFAQLWISDALVANGPPDDPRLDAWTALAAIAQATSRIRLGVLVSGNVYRHPAVLAKIATTVDVVSGGRLEVGLGAGWFEEEHRQYGLPLPPLGERMRRLEEACRILEALWTQPRATFEGTYYQVREAYHEPKPVQRPHPPLVIGTSGERVGLRIAARHAQTWNMARATPAEFSKKSALLDEYCREIGRDPAEIERSIQFLPDAMQGDVAALARDFIGAGATHLIFSCPTPYGAAGARWVWDEVVARIRP